MTQNLHVDQGLTSIPALVEIAGTFNGIDPGSIAFVTAPTHPHPEDPNRLQLEEQPAQKLFATLQQDVGVTGGTQGSSSPSAPSPATPDDAAPAAPGAAAPSSATPSASAPAVAPALVPVTVINRSDAGGRDAQLVSVLKKAGYEQTRSGRSGAQLSATQIFYHPDWAVAADDVARLLNVSDSQLVASYEVEGVEVAVGQDFTSGDRMTRDQQLPDGLDGQTAEQFTCQATADG